MFSTSGPAWHSVENRDDQGPLGLHCVREQEVTCFGSRRGFTVLSFPQKFKLLLTPLPMGIENTSTRSVSSSWSPESLLLCLVMLNELPKWTKWKLLSCIRLFASPWPIQSMEFYRILEWVAFPFSRGSSQPRDRNQVSCIAGGFFTSWATRDLPKDAQWIVGKNGIDPALSLFKFCALHSILHSLSLWLLPGHSTW